MRGQYLLSATHTLLLYLTNISRAPTMCQMLSVLVLTLRAALWGRYYSHSADEEIKVQKSKFLN